ncbi:biotin/lipoyl-binding protein, partial [Sphingomonas adhaesiva]
MADADPRRDTSDGVTASPTATPADVAAALPPEAGPRRRWGRLALMLSVPLLLVLVGGWMWMTSGRYVSTDNAYVQQDMTSISPDVSGRIVAVNVRENQRVRAGDVLFRIDPEPYRIALLQADAALAEARVDVSTKATDSGGAAAS